jgi:hypothetical protein
MNGRRRGIRLKALSPDDPGIQELLDSDLCVPEDPDDPEEIDQVPAGPPPTPPPVSEVAREVLAGLRETLAVLRGDLPGTEPEPAPPDPGEPP